MEYLKKGILAVVLVLAALILRSIGLYLRNSGRFVEAVIFTIVFIIGAIVLTGIIINKYTKSKKKK